VIGVALRLSELLERIRPAGTPGAAAEGAPRDRQLTADEVAELAGALAVLEREADQMLAAARVQAAKIIAEGERTARAVGADLPDRLAVARSEASRAHDAARDAETERIAADAVAEIARLRDRFAERAPVLVAAALDAVWSIAPTGASDEVQR
jgi:vacuolar-type H+-ATPase subunit H